MPAPTTLSALRSRFASAVADRIFTRAEADAVTDEAGREPGGAPLASVRHIDAFAFAAVDVAGDGAARLREFVQAAARQAPNDTRALPSLVALRAHATIAAPAVRPDDSSDTRVEPVGGQLYVDGISANDPVQGTLGDCFFVASVSAIAAQNRALIERAIVDNGDGTFTVKLFEPARRRFASAMSPAVTHKIVVDGALPVRAGRLRYASSRDEGELWVSLLEKAFAQLRGGYERLDGGDIATVMTALAGAPAEVVWLSPSIDEAQMHDALTRALAAGWSLAVGTRDEREHEAFRGSALRPSHAYAVLGASTTSAGVRMVELRDPWGAGQPRRRRRPPPRADGDVPQALPQAVRRVSARARPRSITPSSMATAGASPASAP